MTRYGPGNLKIRKRIRRGDPTPDGRHTVWEQYQIVSSGRVMSRWGTLEEAERELERLVKESRP